MITITGKMI